MERIVKMICLYLCLVAASLVLVLQSFAKFDLRTAVAVWLFDEGKGNTTEDFTENGNSGTLMNGTEWTDGKIGKALKFDGIDDYVSISSQNGFPKGSSARTISLWFKWSEVKWQSPGIELMGYGTNSNSQRLGIWIDSSHAFGIETCNYGRVFS